MLVGSVFSFMPRLMQPWSSEYAAARSGVLTMMSRSVSCQTTAGCCHQRAMPPAPCLSLTTPLHCCLASCSQRSWTHTIAFMPHIRMFVTLPGDTSGRSLSADLWASYKHRTSVPGVLALVIDSPVHSSGKCSYCRHPGNSEEEVRRTVCWRGRNLRRCGCFRFAGCFLCENKLE